MTEKIITFNAEYNEQIKKYRELFINGGDISGKVRKMIADSWARCMYWNVNPEEIDYNPLTSEEFSIIKKEEHELIDVTEPIINRIFDQTKHLECLFSFANARGIMLQTWIGNWNSKLKPGAYVRESTTGTSGIATSIYEGKFVIIYGYEHYCEPNHDIVCTACPIFDHKNTLIGAISMSCSLSAYHPYNSVIIQEAAKSITEQVRLRFLLFMDQMLIESFGEGVLLLNKKGQILRANSKAMSLLQRKADNTVLNIDDLFYPFGSRKNIETSRSFSNEEVKLIEDEHTAKELYFTLNFTPTDNGGVLTFRPTKEIHASVSKVLNNYAVYQFCDILGESPQIKECIELSKKMADSSHTILLLGQSGTGKELFAQAIHNRSDRKDKPFIAVNCGALPRDLIQSELFGYAEGAFTGASKKGKPGKFEMADEGTLFLDEIGEMSLDTQVNLLRFLQNREVVRIGGKAVRILNVRLIAATNRDLEEEVRLKRFRADLYYRLNVFTLHIPSLNERKDDIPVLARAFLQKIADQHVQFRSMIFSNDAMEALENRIWKGNVRELEHSIERAVFTATGNIIQAEDFAFPEYTEKTKYIEPVEKIKKEKVLSDDKEKEEKDVIEEALTQTEGNVVSAASLLGISKATLYIRCMLYGISPKSFKRLKIRK